MLLCATSSVVAGDVALCSRRASALTASCADLSRGQSVRRVSCAGVAVGRGRALAAILGRPTTPQADRKRRANTGVSGYAYGDGWRNRLHFPSISRAKQQFLNMRHHRLHGAASRLNAVGDKPSASTPASSAPVDDSEEVSSATPLKMGLYLYLSSARRAESVLTPSAAPPCAGGGPPRVHLP